MSSSQLSLLSAFCSSVVLEVGLAGELGDFAELGVEGIFFAFLSGNEFRTSESGYNLYNWKRTFCLNSSYDLTAFTLVILGI